MSDQTPINTLDRRLGIGLYFGLYVFGIYLRSTVKAPAWTAAPAPSSDPEP